MAKPPDLQSTAGMADPFYSYFWEFGDGHYSLNKNPCHTYAKKGDFQVNLALTSNYDDGPLRPTKPIIVKNEHQIRDSTQVKGEIKPFGKNLLLWSNHQIRSGDDIVMILGYSGLKNNSNGTLYLFYNQRENPRDVLSYASSRLHYKEENLQFGAIGPLAYQREHLFGSEKQSALASQKDHKKTYAKLLNTYKNYIQFDFSAIKQQEWRNTFHGFKCNPLISTDTGMVVKLTALYVPENGDPIWEDYFIPIVSAHDPNYTKVNVAHLSQNKAKETPLLYTTHFENRGDGNAEYLRISVKLDDNLDSKSLKILDYQPYCSFCDILEEDNAESCLSYFIQNDSIYFEFKNIFLRGKISEEKMGTNKGYIQYALQTKTQLNTYAIKNRAEIIFDNEAPIPTNTVKTYIKPKWGKSMYFQKSMVNSTIGCGFNIFSKNKTPWAWSSGMFYSRAIESQKDISQSSTKKMLVSAVDSVWMYKSGFVNEVHYINRQYEIDAAIKSTVVKQISQVHQLNLRPISATYFHRYIGIGIGPVFQIDVLSKINTTENTHAKTFSEIQWKQNQSIQYWNEQGTLTLKEKQFSNYLDISSIEYTTEKHQTSHSGWTYFTGMHPGLMADVFIGNTIKGPYTGLSFTGLYKQGAIQFNFSYLLGFRI